jgi:hypothetical protein
VARGIVDRCSELPILQLTRTNGARSGRRRWKAICGIAGHVGDLHLSSKIFSPSPLSSFCPCLFHILLLAFAVRSSPDAESVDRSTAHWSIGTCCKPKPLATCMESEGSQWMIPIRPRFCILSAQLSGRSIIVTCYTS